MADSLLSSEEYDERAHRLYDDGEYDCALVTLKEGLRYYPHSVELYVGLGYTQLAREEFAWAKQAFERSLVLDPNHEDALIGLGEASLRFGRRDEALRLFGRARELGADDLDLLLTRGRALFRERLYGEARPIFEAATTMYAESAEAAAALGFTCHRLGDESAARRQLRRALHLDPAHHEARVYLAHMMYDHGDWAGALRDYERIPIVEHWDPLAVVRVIELKRALEGLAADAVSLCDWRTRLDELEQADELEALLLELEADGAEDDMVPRADEHRVVFPDGTTLVGTWLEILGTLRDSDRIPGETIAEYMRRRALEVRHRTGVELPHLEVGAFLNAGARAGYWRIDY
jgi:Flp pilus assembly protein TadD